MQWFERFATEGLLFPAFMIAFGSLVVLRSPSTPTVTDAPLVEAPRWVRWLARKNSERLQRRCGWTITAFAVVIAVARIS